MNDIQSPTPTSGEAVLPYALLQNLGVLRAQGPDAPSFLHGQFSNDILTLMPGHARLAGYLTPNGRLLATFWVIRHDMPPAADQPAVPTFWLVCSRDLAAAMAKRLSMYVLRAKCKIVDASNDHAVLGFVGPARRATQALAGHEDVVVAAALPDVTLTETTADMLTTSVRHRLGSDRLLVRSLLVVPRALVVPAADTTDAPAGTSTSASEAPQASGSAEAPRDDQAATAQATGAAPAEAPQGDNSAAADASQPAPRFRMSESDWLQLDVASGIPWICAASSETFVPQMVNLELVGGVNFKKGCYPGQEVVARSEYRGKVKRRMFAGMCSGPLPEPGTDVLAWDGTPIGQVIHVASLSADTDDEVIAGNDLVMDSDQEELPIVLVGRRFLLLFEARIEVIGAQPRSAGMIATSLRIGNAAIGLLKLPYDIPEC
jgi:putative aminomethyl transferase